MIRIRASLPVLLLAAPGLAGGAPAGAEQSALAPSLFFLAGALLAVLLLRPVVRQFPGIAGRCVGRWQVRRLLERLGPDVLHDFIVPAVNGGLAKIDHAVRLADGILCVQVRHHRGLVFGDKQDAQWGIVDGAERRRFLNPLVNAEGCRRAIGKIVPGVPVRCVVVFTGAVQFASARPDGILQPKELRSYLAGVEISPGGTGDRDAAWQALRAAALTDEATRRDHAAQLGFI